MSSFVSKAIKDKRVVSLHKALERGVYFVDIEKIDQEVDQLHISRKVRELKTTELMQSFNKKFVTASLQNQAYRSRLVEIKMKCYRISAKLEEHLKAIRGHLKTTYPKTLMAYKTQADRNAAIDSVLEEPIKRLKKLSRSDAVIDMVINDIDQASWSLKSILTVFENVDENKSAKF